MEEYNLNMEEYNLNKENKLHVAILGTCCMRDTIGYYHEGEKFIVDRFVQDISPMTLTGVSPLKKPLDDFLYNADITDGKNNQIPFFRRRNFVLDLNKTVIDYLTETNAEWLLIDVACLRLHLTSVNSNYISNALFYSEVIKVLTNNGFMDLPEKEILADTISDNELYCKLDEYVEKILKVYKQEKIILFDICPAKYCANVDGTVSAFVTEKKYEPVYKGFKYVKQKLQRAHVIECPFNILGDQKHKWGKYSLHYVREYYDYAYAALEKITGGGTLRLKKKKRI